MPVIKLLDKSVAELIAAGEVIERPASVIKELVENSTDAGARHITVEIKNGGIGYMRIADDGCGIAFDEMPTAFLRHATSKISSGEDLASIMTMGFRGEALASVAAVSHAELMSKRKEDELGGRFVIHGGEPVSHEVCGCPDGTTLIVRDLFFNTPARLKFLKKDVSEGNYVASVIDKLALAHPDISFRFIRDNKPVRLTPGDGMLISAVKAIYGRQFACSLVPVDFTQGGINVEGFVSSPLFCRNSRATQSFFVNTRYIKSGTCAAALEEAYRNSIMTGKFPACVLNITMPAENVDVNVHPAKTEIRFAQEKPVFDAVYMAVKNALLNAADDRRDIKLPERKGYHGAEDYFAKNPVVTPVKQQALCQSESTAADGMPEKPVNSQKSKEATTVFYSESKTDDTALHSFKKQYEVNLARLADENEPPLPAAPPGEVRYLPPVSVIVDAAEDSQADFDISAKEEIPTQPEKRQIEAEQPQAEQLPCNPPQTEQTEAVCEPQEEAVFVRVIGEFAKTYIICEAGDELILIDKHAAHERIRFEKLKKEFVASSQLLLEETRVKLSAEEYDALSEYYSFAEECGIELVFDDDCTVLVTAMPSVVSCSPEEIVCAVAQRLINYSADQSGALFDDMLHTMACKSAIKAHDDTDITELEALAGRVFSDKSIRFCPHGRPVTVSLKKSRIERFFNRS